MNHYINLLDPSECYYLSSAESNPLYKLGAVGVVIVILGINVLKYQGLKQTIKEGEALKTWVAENEGSLDGADKKIALSRDVEKAYEAITGWQTSRLDYDRFLTTLIEQIPLPASRVQFTGLRLSEEIIGLYKPRDNRSAGQTESYPLERTVTVTLQGVVEGSRPELFLGEYKNNLSRENGDNPISQIVMRLNMEAPIGGDVEEELTQFSSKFTLKPRVFSK